MQNNTTNKPLFSAAAQQGGAILFLLALMAIMATNMVLATEASLPQTLCTVIIVGGSLLLVGCALGILLLICRLVARAEEAERLATQSVPAAPPPPRCEVVTALAQCEALQDEIDRLRYESGATKKSRIQPSGVPLDRMNLPPLMPPRNKSNRPR